MDFEAKQKKMDKLFKDHKKMIKESVKTEMRAKE